jgi:hypothetical protein
MIYRIGKVNDPRDDDPRIEGLDAAIAAALDMSDESTWDSYVVAVWEDDGYGRIAALCYQSGVYTP